MHGDASWRSASHNGETKDVRAVVGDLSVANCNLGMDYKRWIVG